MSLRDKQTGQPANWLTGKRFTDFTWNRQKKLGNYLYASFDFGRRVGDAVAVRDQRQAEADGRGE
jgi:hypothetical protein